MGFVCVRAFGVWLSLEICGADDARNVLCAVSQSGFYSDMYCIQRFGGKVGSLSKITTKQSLKKNFYLFIFFFF